MRPARTDHPAFAATGNLPPNQAMREGRKGRILPRACGATGASEQSAGEAATLLANTSALQVCSAQMTRATTVHSRNISTAGQRKARTTYAAANWTRLRMYKCSRPRPVATSYERRWPEGAGPNGILRSLAWLARPTKVVSFSGSPLPPFGVAKSRRASKPAASLGGA
jgi:hypothetical protein